MSAQFLFRSAFVALVLLRGPLSGAEIRVVGSDLLGPGFQQAVQEFARANDTTVTLDLRGTRPGMDAMRAGRADVGLFMFPPGESPPGDPFEQRPLAYQAVFVLVPATLPVTQITVDQLRGVFAAAVAIPIERWGDLGLTGDSRLRAIAPRTLAAGSGLTTPLFRRLVLQDAGLRASVEQEKSAEDLFASLRRGDNTIGLSPALPEPPAGLRVLALATSSSDPAFAPTPEALHDGNYSLRLPLYLVFPRVEAPRLQLFLKFLVSDECARQLVAASFIPLPKAVREKAGFDFEVLR